MTTLTKSDKIALIDARMRNLEYRKYGLDLDAIVENAKLSPDQDALAVISGAIDELNIQIAALNAELTAVNSTPDQE